MSITGGYSYSKFISSVVVFPDNYFSRGSKIRWSSTGIKNTKCLRLIDDKSHSVPRELWVTIVSSLCHERGNYFYDDKNCDTNTNIILPLAIQQAVVVEMEFAIVSYYITLVCVFHYSGESLSTRCLTCVHLIIVSVR